MITKRGIARKRERAYSAVLSQISFYAGKTADEAIKHLKDSDMMLLTSQSKTTEHNIEAMERGKLNQTFHLRNCSVGIRQDCADLYFCESAQAFPLERGAGSGNLFKRYDLAGAKYLPNIIWGSLVIMRLDDSDPIPPPSKEKIKS